MNGLWEQIRATHRDLSPTAERFLDHVLREPEAGRRMDYREAADRSEWVRLSTYRLQPWPVFLGLEKRRQIEHATLEMLRLVRGIPERIFDRDARRIWEFYGWGSELHVAFLLEPPDGFAGSLARCDFIDDGAGLRCMEVNMTAFLGGWQLRFWDRACLEAPSIVSFLRQEGIDPVHRDPWHAAFSHVVRDVQEKGLAGDGVLNVALVTAAEVAEMADSLVELNELYTAVLESTGLSLSGRLFVCSYAGDLAPKRGALFHGDAQIHAVVEYTNDLTPQEVYRCFKAETLGLYNGPLTALLGDKRNLALLSQFADSDRFDREEREFINSHIPWSREVVDGKTRFAGETVSLLDFALAHRERLVLKAAQGVGGKGVHIGSATPQDEWERRLRAAAGSKGWLLQELVRSRPYLGQDAAGPAPHDVVWGTFGFGSSYGGAFLRMLPSGGVPGVINAARGATEGFVFEV
ncbi:MAG TPA: hypothetical protein VMW27_29880 [Thermoanaerobaculia bacterium]|nr:hypothetical protein [Thermoanaerobaculia bacterium]